MPGKQVIIGYHKNDRRLVEKLDEDLGKRGLRVWIDTRNLKPGTSRRQGMFDGIAASDTFIACLSPDFLEDEFCRTQVFLARAHGKKLLPVLATGEFGRRPAEVLAAAGGRYPHAIKGIEDLYILDLSGTYLVWGDGSYEKNFEKLVSAIRPVPKPKPLNSNLLYISYNWKDTEFANRMARDLQMARARVWIDKLSIEAGDNWRDAMYAGLREAGYFIVCLSPEAADSENVGHEVLIARMRGLPVLPVVSDRIAGDSFLMSGLEESIRNSEEMRFLSDLVWFKPEPDYQAQLANLKQATGLTAAERAPKQGIFLSYRRADSQASSGRIHEKLVERFGAETVFKDVDNIPPGVQFSEYYKNWLREKAAVALIMIGAKWGTIAEKEGGTPRLQDAADHVRIEVEIALSLEGLRVIPVFVDAAEMPARDKLPESLRRLTDLNGCSVRPDPDFGSDMKKLMAAIERPA